MSKLVETNVAQHVRVHPGHPDSGRCGEVPEPAGCGVAVHPRPVNVAQDRPAVAVLDGPVEGSGHRWWERDQDDLAAFAAHAHDAVAVFFSEIADVRGAGFEDPQPDQAEHGDEREVVRVVRQSRGGDHCLELQVAQSEGG
jgi:hypothetical protein